MKFLFLYFAISALVASWTGWHIHQKLDKFDWAYHKTKIWLALVLRTNFWPLMLLFNPSELLSPKFGFRADFLGIDLAKTARERSQFMESPPPCGSTILYRLKKDDSEATKASFYFSANAVEDMAHKLINETGRVEGLRGAAKWASLRDESIVEPTELPRVLVNFDYICDGLIEAGHGKMHCLACNKVYGVSELVKNTGFVGSWLIADYYCPAQHLLMSRDLAHFMFKRD